MKVKQRILLVDDDPGVAGIVRQALEKTGNYDVRVEYRGIDSLPAARAFRPDLLVLDVVMPDCDGPDVLSQFREDAELRHTPVMFLTGTMTEEGMATRGGLIAGYTIVSKQTPVGKLIRYVDQMLRTSAARG